MRNNPFIHTIRKRCRKLNVHLQLRNGYTCKTPDGDICDGFFIPPDSASSGILAVATGRPTDAWQYTLCHEYVHMLQWFRDDEILDAPYYELEKATEREAMRVAKEFGLNVAKCQTESRNYMAYLKTLRQK